MSLVAVQNQQADDAALHEGAEWCVRRYAEEARDYRPGEGLPIGEHANLCNNPRSEVVLSRRRPTTHVGLYTQHTAEEFDLELETQGNNITPFAERTCCPARAR